MQPETLFDGVTFDPKEPGEVRDWLSPSTACKAEHRNRTNVQLVEGCVLLLPLIGGVVHRALWALVSATCGHRACRRRARPGR